MAVAVCRGMRSLGAALFCVFLFGCTTGDEADDTADATDYSTVAKIQVLRGVDRAGEFSVAEARRLHDDHGVRWTGVYIGGACNGGFGWTKGGVEAIAHATHWRFMPIWVGQQEAALCGAHRLTYARGKTDGQAAAARMKAFGWGAHKAIPVALDVEAGTYFGNPAAATSYVHGWIRAVRLAGYRPYVYSTPFGLNHFHDKGLRIDGAWAASYFYHHFENVAPAHLDQMGSRYRHHNRAWQYAGNFAVAGAGNVDADTSNLLLAPAPGGTNKSMARDVPSGCGGLQPGEGLERGESVSTCDGATTLAMTDDGDLQLTTNGQTVWTAGTNGAGQLALLDGTGELVVFDDQQEPVFTSDTEGFPDAQVAFDTHGISIVTDDAQTVWSNGTGIADEDELGMDYDEAAGEGD